MPECLIPDCYFLMPETGARSSGVADLTVAVRAWPEQPCSKQTAMALRNPPSPLANAP
jgi:hypothetical protein